MTTKHLNRVFDLLTFSFSFYLKQTITCLTFKTNINKKITKFIKKICTLKKKIKLHSITKPKHFMTKVFPVYLLNGFEFCLNYVYKKLKIVRSIC